MNMEKLLNRVRDPNAAIVCPAHVCFVAIHTQIRVVHFAAL